MYKYCRSFVFLTVLRSLITEYTARYLKGVITMKKAAALLTSAAILSACVSCGNKSVSSSSDSVSERQPTVFEAVQLEDAAYKRENLKSPDDI